MYWLLRPWRHAFDFSGRSPRREYWLFVLQSYVLAIALVMVSFALDSPPYDLRSSAANTVLIVAGLFWLVSIIPGLAVAVRRLHDHDKSGLMLLLGFIPFIGGLILLFFMLTPGDDHENDYGPNPLEQEEMHGVSEVFE